MSRVIYINLPVRDLTAATRFYEAIGCRKNPQFSDDKASSMVWSDRINFQLLTREYFATFIDKPVADARASTAMLLALSCDSRPAVDALVQTAAAAGGKADPRAVMDMGWLYNRTVEDPDGHVLEAVWLDPAGMPQHQPG
jgi:uncharacterized protein